MSREQRSFVRVMGARSVAFAVGLMPAPMLQASTVWVEGNVEQVAVTGDGRFGGCMAEVDMELAEAGLDCSERWVSFGCSGDHAESEEPGRVFEALRSAVVMDRSVGMRVTDEIKRDGYCHASRIKIQDDPHVDEDSDADGVLDLDDDFPLDASETLDSDADGIGNNADPDDDNDGVGDSDDAFPFDPDEHADSDGDGVGDNADPDDDNDGIPDEEETRIIALDAANEVATGITYADGNLYVVDSADDRVYVYGADGERNGALDFDLDTDFTTSPDGITYADKRLYVANRGTHLTGPFLVAAYRTSGEIDRARVFDLDEGGPFDTAGIAFGDGRFLVVDSVEDHVHAYSATGERLTGSGFDLTSTNSDPAGITFANGWLFVVDDADKKVYAYRASGEREAGLDFVLDLENASAGGISYADGAFYVVDSGTDSIYVYSAVVAGLASPDMIASPGTEVILGATAFLDCASPIDGYRWGQLTGPNVSMDVRAAAPRFVVPEDAEGMIAFRVEATCGANQQLSDIVTVSVVSARVERVLSALVDFEDVPVSERPFSRADLAGLLVDDADSLANYFRAASRGLVDARFDVLDWVTVGKRRGDYPLGGGSVVSDVVDRLSEVADLGRYDKVFPAIFPLEQGSPGCAAYLEPIHFRTSKGTFRLGAAWLSGYDMGCVKKGRHAHEFGHTFGFGHSLVLDCETETGVPVSTIDPTDRDSCINYKCLNEDCTEVGEGDTSFILNKDPDMMGGDSPRNYEDYFPLVFQAVWQAHAGWLTREQIVTTTGSHWITTLESLSPTPKAIRIRLGRDHVDGFQEYWLETRNPLPDAYEFHPRRAVVERCSLAVRLASPNRYAGERFIGFGDSVHTHTWRFAWLSGRTWQPGEYPVYRGVRDGEPFWDPYRGVRFELAECVEFDHEVAVRVDVARSELQAKPPIAAVLRNGEANVTVTNMGARPVSIGQPSIRGRHADAFTLGAEDCAGVQLRPGKTCGIEVETVADSESVAFLYIPNDDDLAPELTVSLVVRQESTTSGSAVPIRVEHGADH